MLAHLMTKGCFLFLVPNLLHPSSGGKAKKKSVNHTEEQLGKPVVPILEDDFHIAVLFDFGNGSRYK